MILKRLFENSPNETYATTRLAASGHDFIIFLLCSSSVCLNDYMKWISYDLLRMFFLASRSSRGLVHGCGWLACGSRERMTWRTVQRMSQKQWRAMITDKRQLREHMDMMHRNFRMLMTNPPSMPTPQYRFSYFHLADTSTRYRNFFPQVRRVQNECKYQITIRPNMMMMMIMMKFQGKKAGTKGSERARGAGPSSPLERYEWMNGWIHEKWVSPGHRYRVSLRTRGTPSEMGGESLS